HLVRGQLRDTAAGDDLVMVHDERAVRRGVHVQLHGVGAQLRRGAERGKRVLDLAGGGAAVRNDERPGRTHLSKLSAFFASIQPDSFSMSCTVSYCSGWGSTVFRHAAYLAGSTIGSPSTGPLW